MQHKASFGKVQMSGIEHWFQTFGFFDLEIHHQQKPGTQRQIANFLFYRRMSFINSDRNNVCN